MAAKRRKRFVVRYLKDGVERQGDALGYTAEGIRVNAIRAGLDVLSVRPYVKGERFTPPANGGFRINSLNLRSAERYLGLTWPLQIKKTNVKGGRRGAYRPILHGGRPHHKITIKSYLEPVRAGKTLWHELRHARQAEDCYERAGRDWEKFSKLRHADMRDGTSYLEKRREVEARATEVMNETYPLARPL